MSLWKRVRTWRPSSTSGPTFTSDWTTHNFDKWTEILGPRRPEIRSILEIGSFEGRSAIFFAEFFQQARITCIDTFRGKYEANFDRNTRPYRSRIKKIKGRSAQELDKLVFRTWVFDLIYVDGDHTRAGVLIDAFLAFRLLRPGGILIFDDYLWNLERPVDQRPQQAIDLFQSVYANELILLHAGYQKIFQRKPIGDAAAPPG